MLTVQRLMQLDRRLDGRGCHLRLQSPLTIAPWHEPEPDALIARGSAEDYQEAHPQPGDVSCVIEVADSSLHRDRTTKLKIYAAAGIGQYLIANLGDRVVEMHTEPVAAESRFARRDLVGPGEVVGLSLPDGSTLELDVASLLL
jgi:Uma2 family endonuclease